MAYKKTIIRQFKGLSQKLALTAGSPEFALDCVNALPSISGLAKLRYPTDLSTAIGGNGPDQFGMYESSTQKYVLGFFGEDVYLYTLDGFTSALIGTNALYNGVVPWNVIESNNNAFIQNGSSNPLKVVNGVLAFWGIQRGSTPTLGVAAGTGITLTSGRKYRLAYKDDDGAVGTASAGSASTGALANKYQPVTLPAPTFADGRITKGRLYATLDGGNDYFFHSEVTGSFPMTINDSTPDTGLDQSERAPLINDQPPKAKFMCQWGGRIFMFNLPEENSKFIAYTGYNRIFVGRPEETCPPGNRIKLDTGADDIAGGGVIPQGVVAFDKSNKMFMFRGQPEDITVDAPVEFTLFMQQLPYDIGCISHYTICSTVRGLVWLGVCLGIYVFDGSKPPEDLSEGAEPILRTINMAAAGNSRAVYWQYRGRDWYILAIPTGTETALNKILIVDLDANEEKNFGIVPLDIGTFQSIGIVEMTDGTQKLVVGQDGILKEISITSSTKNGIEETVSSTSATLGGYWVSGLVGNDSPEVEKFFRWGRVTADQNGIRIKRRLYKDSITQPEVMEFEDTPPGGKISTNRKGRRLSYELRFRDEDVSQNILELLDVSIPLAER